MVSEEARDKNNEYVRRWRLKNPHYDRKWRANDPNRVERNRISRREWGKRNVKHTREYALKRAYGITQKEWDELFESQGSKCAACGAADPGSKKGWHTDHCHSTSTLRGILCQRCNLAIGLVKEDPRQLRACADYLEKHNPLFTLV